MQTDLMIYIETLGTSPKAPMVQICALPFVGGTFDPNPANMLYVNVAVGSDRTIDYDTALWWMRQSEQAQECVFKAENRVDAGRVLNWLEHWCFVHPAGRIWSRGPLFDVGILEDYFRSAGRKIPWKYSNVRDLRTAMALVGVDTKDIPREEGIEHTSLSGCLHQIKCLAVVRKRLNDYAAD